MTPKVKRINAKFNTGRHVRKCARVYVAYDFETMKEKKINVDDARLHDFNRGELQVSQANEKCDVCFLPGPASGERRCRWRDCSLRVFILTRERTLAWEECVSSLRHERIHFAIPFRSALIFNHKEKKRKKTNKHSSAQIKIKCVNLCARSCEINLR